MDLAWGYGQRPGRLLFFSIPLCVLFGGLFDLTGVKIGEACLTGRTAPNHLAHLGDCIYYSFVTFTTVGYGDIVPCGALSRALASLEALSGIFTKGLFVTANVRKLEGR